MGGYYLSPISQSRFLVSQHNVSLIVLTIAFLMSEPILYLNLFLLVLSPTEHESICTCKQGVVRERCVFSSHPLQIVLPILMLRPSSPAVFCSLVSTSMDPFP